MDPASLEGRHGLELEHLAGLDDPRSRPLGEVPELALAPAAIQDARCALQWVIANGGDYYVDPTRIGNEGRLVVSELGGKANTRIRAEQLGHQLEGVDPQVLSRLIKQLEADGMAFEGAEASFELLIRRHSPGYEAPFRIVDYTCLVEQRSGQELLAEATVKVEARTGVEMEALVAVSAAALTLYDMCKAVDRGMVIEGVHLVSKLGGKSGEWRRSDDPLAAPSSRR